MEGAAGRRPRRADRLLGRRQARRRDPCRARGRGSLAERRVPGELDAIIVEARSLGLVAPVSVRLNPDVEPRTHGYVSTGQATSKFGLPGPEVLAGLRRAAHEPSLRPVGISFHIGSQLTDPAPVLVAAERALELWRELAAGGVRLRDLDVGGGLGIPYDGESELDVDWYARELATRAGEVGATLVLEPGRWLVGPAGTFVTRVLYVKDVPGRRIAVCDGGMNDLIRPSLYGAEHPIALVGGEKRPQGAVDVVGPVCESGDFFARGRDLPLPEPGDLVAIGHAGAYGRVMASTYNARPFCAEVLVEDGAWRVIREAGTHEDLVRGETL